eukprot:4036734-Amphidinium_carterae.1
MLLHNVKVGPKCESGPLATWNANPITEESGVIFLCRPWKLCNSLSLQALSPQEQVFFVAANACLHNCIGSPCDNPTCPEAVGGHAPAETTFLPPSLRWSDTRTPCSHTGEIKFGLLHLWETCPQWVSNNRREQNWKISTRSRMPDLSAPPKAKPQEVGNLQQHKPPGAYLS